MAGHHQSSPWTRSAVTGQRKGSWTVDTLRYKDIILVLVNNTVILQRDDCGAGEAAGAVCDTRTEETEQQDEQNCFQVGVGYNPGDWIGG